MPIQEYSLDPELLDKINMGASGGPIGRGATEGPWYVDLNRRAAGDGSSWDEAYDTYAKGIAGANAFFGVSANRAWAKRGTVYCCSDGETESIVALPARCDLVGVGTDGGPFPKVTGTHTIAATSTPGVRIINMGFIHGGTTAPMLTLPTGSHGIQLHHVRIYKAEGSLPTVGLLMTNTRDFVLNDVHVYPDAASDYCTIGLQVAGTSGGMGRAQIINCLIAGDEAFDVVSTTGAWEGAMCRNSVFVATNLCIDENSDTMAFINNRLYTAAASGSAAGSGIVDWDGCYIAGNYAQSSDGAGPLPDLNAHG